MGRLGPGAPVGCLAALSVTIWWARTTVQTAETQLQIERRNVKALKAYAEIAKKKVDEDRKKTTDGR